MKRFNSRKLRKLEVVEQYQVKISNTFAALDTSDCEDDDDYVDMNRAWESIRKNIRASPSDNQSYYELKHKSWFDEVLKSIR
jgi:hypothetical protein